MPLSPFWSFEGFHHHPCIELSFLELLLCVDQTFWLEFHVSTKVTFSNYLILHFNMTFNARLVPRLNVSIFFFTLTRFFGRQAVTCPSPLLSTSKSFLTIFTISSYQFTSYFESTIKLIICYCVHHFDNMPRPHISFVSCSHIWAQIQYNTYRTKYLWISASLMKHISPLIVLSFNPAKPT